MAILYASALNPLPVRIPPFIYHLIVAVRGLLVHPTAVGTSILFSPVPFISEP